MEILNVTSNQKPIMETLIHLVQGPVTINQRELPKLFVMNIKRKYKSEWHVYLTLLAHDYLWKMAE